jgi:hypothetical protein
MNHSKFLSFLAHADVRNASLTINNTPSRLGTAVRRFWGFPRRKKLAYILFGSTGLFGSYVGVCTLVHLASKASLDEEFSPTSPFAVHQRMWDEVERELQPGDVLLMMGTSTMSWKICNSQFVHSFFRPAAIRYSHVALVVAPLEPPTVDQVTGKVLRPGHGALIYEVMDNTDCYITDYLTNTIRTMSPQVVEAKKRIFALDTVTGKPCYCRLGVRRLVRLRSDEMPDWSLDELDGREVILKRRDAAKSGLGSRPALTPEMVRRLWSFIADHDQYAMDDSPMVMLAFVHPAVTRLIDHRGGRTMTTCSELLAKLLLDVGVTQEYNALTGRRVWHRAVAPYQFGNGLEDRIGLTGEFQLTSEERIPIGHSAASIETSIVNRE